MSLLHPGHGKGAGRPHIEVPAVHELPAGMPAHAPAEAGLVPGSTSRAFGPLPKGSPDAAQLARHAAAERWRKVRAEQAQVRALDSLGLHGMPPEAMHPYLLDADQFAEHERARIAAEVGGGQCGAGPTTMIQSAALALAGSRYLYASGSPTNLALAARLATESRQHLLAAHTLAALEAKARADSSTDPFQAALDRINAGAQ